MTSAQNILTNLVSFPVLGGQSNLDIIAYIQTYLDQYGVESHLVENVAEKKASLHCRIGPAVSGGVILSGHTDVVPVEGQPWDTDPFVLTEKEGKLYGRGSCDMKGFVACCLAVVPEMVKAELKKPIYFAFSYDEEIGCLAGPELAKAIHDHYEEEPAYAIIGEPSLMEPIVGQKGICIYKTTVNGSAGHSSRIKGEVSAIHEACRLVLWLENKMDRLIEAGRLDDRFSPNHTSLHIGMIEGGIAPNVIADHCSFSWDVRLIPKDNAQEIYQEFEAFCREREHIVKERYPEFRIVTEEVHPFVPALDTPDHLPVVEFIKNLSQNRQLNAVSYASEAGQFSDEGFQSVICGPGSIAQAHRANEFIEIHQLNLGVEMIQRLVRELSH
ncbi:MAG: acetylornithine deacetylase [Bacteroidota bacterium]